MVGLITSLEEVAKAQQVTQAAPAQQVTQAAPFPKTVTHLQLFSSTIQDLSQAIKATQTRSQKGFLSVITFIDSSVKYLR